jgi:hypothetical protein
MDSRRITLHLIKSVGSRINSAEVDRVWDVSQGPLMPPVTYVLEAKWGLVTRRALDDFLNVLKFSTDFGVDTPEGRQVKQGIVGVFAAPAFNPRERIPLGNETVSLASYASRLNVNLLKASDFHAKLRVTGCNKKRTIQSICRAARNEDQVRELLKKIWGNPPVAEQLLSEVRGRNEDLYGFEKALE